MKPLNNNLKKQDKAWELTRLWYTILSETSNVFITMTKEQENNWEQEFHANTMMYTEEQIDALIGEAKANRAINDYFVPSEWAKPLEISVDGKKTIKFTPMTAEQACNVLNIYGWNRSDKSWFRKTTVKGTKGVNYHWTNGGVNYKAFIPEALDRLIFW